MRLERFTSVTLKILYGHKLCCFGCAGSYIEEMCAAYEVAEYIDKIIDENVRNHGIHNFRGRDIEVCGIEYFDRMNNSEMIICITSDYIMEVYDRLSNMQKLKDSIDVVYYYVNKETEYESAYREKYKDSKLEHLILFRSGPHASSHMKGMDFADNARALFEYMLHNGYNQKYKLVWLVENPDEFMQYQDINNVNFISYKWSVSQDQAKRDIYYRVLCLAKYIFFTDAYGFARNCRRDQIRVQLWHGCGFKTRVNFVRCEKRYEYTTVISELYSKIHQDIYGLRKDQMLVTGYAKQDWLFHPAVDWQDRLGIPMSEKYIFWLPTFRTAKEQLRCLNEHEFDNQTGLPIAGTFEMLVQLDELLQSLDIVLVLKLHPFQDVQKIGRINMRNIVVLDSGLLVEKDIQINQLLGNADALISDYSSAAVDYMLLDRPIAFTLDDVENYGQSRGFVFKHIREWLPGMELLSFEDMCKFVIEVGTGNDSTKEKRRDLIRKMHKYQDDRNCMRILEALQL